MLPRHPESEFRVPLDRPRSWASSRLARALAGFGQADIPPHAGPPPETRVNPPARYLGTRRAWNPSLKPTIQNFVCEATPFYQTSRRGAVPCGHFGTAI